MRRKSKKRQAILDCLLNTDEHPTAEIIYNRLKPDFPDLSLATVYRNLGQLEESGEIRSMFSPTGSIRFDGNTSDHIHAVCLKCGSVMDISDTPLPVDIEPCDGFQVLYKNFQIMGICRSCIEKEKQHNKSVDETDLKIQAQ